MNTLGADGLERRPLGAGPRQASLRDLGEGERQQRRRGQPLGQIEADRRVVQLSRLESVLLLDHYRLGPHGRVLGAT